LAFTDETRSALSHLQETEADDNNEEDLTVTHRKHLRFFGIRWRYLRMSIAVLISICFAAAGIVLHDKQKGLVSLCDHVEFFVVISMPAGLNAVMWLPQCVSRSCAVAAPLRCITTEFCMWVSH